MDIFLFIAAIVSMLATAAIIHLVCKHTKLKALVTGITFQPIKQSEALTGKENIIQNCTAQWYTIAALTLMLIGLVIYIFTTTQRCTIFKRKLYSNTVNVMLFFSDVKQYIPVKLYKTAGSIHLFQIYGQRTSNQITLERNFLWDVIKIEWGEVFLTLNGAIVQLPISVKVPLRDKYRLRHMMSKMSLLLHVMLRQGTSWYALDNIEYLLPPPCLEESELLIVDGQQNDCHSPPMQRISQICIIRGHCDSRYGGYDTKRYPHILAGQILQQKTFIPWSEHNKPPPSFLKRLRDTQGTPSKEFLETLVDRNLDEKFRPKTPCKCPKIARMSDREVIMDAKQ